MRQFLLDALLVIAGVLCSRIVFSSLFKPSLAVSKAFSYVAGAAVAIWFYFTWAITGMDPLQLSICGTFPTVKSCQKSGLGDISATKPVAPSPAPNLPIPLEKSETTLPTQKSSLPEEVGTPSETDIKYRRRVAVDDFLHECIYNRPYGINKARIETLMAKLDAIGPPLYSSSRKVAVDLLATAWTDYASGGSRPQRERDEAYAASVKHALDIDPAAFAIYYVDSLLRLGLIDEAEQEIYRELRSLRSGTTPNRTWYDLAVVKKYQGDNTGANAAVLVLLSGNDSRFSNPLEQQAFYVTWCKEMTKQSGWPFDFDQEIDIALRLLNGSAALPN